VPGDLLAFVQGGQNIHEPEKRDLERGVAHHPLHHPACPPFPVEDGRRFRPHEPEDFQPLCPYGIPSGIRLHFFIIARHNTGNPWNKFNYQVRTDN
jgi:hypothetical protein